MSLEKGKSNKKGVLQHEKSFSHTYTSCPHAGMTLFDFEDAFSMKEERQEATGVDMVQVFLQ